MHGAGDVERRTIFDSADANDRRALAVRPAICDEASVRREVEVEERRVLAAIERAHRARLQIDQHQLVADVRQRNLVAAGRGFSRTTREIPGRVVDQVAVRIAGAMDREATPRPLASYTLIRRFHHAAIRRADGAPMPVRRFALPAHPRFPAPRSCRAKSAPATPRSDAEHRTPGIWRPR